MVPEKAMATHSSTLAWRIPWMEEPGGLQSMGWQRVRHDCVTSLSLFTFMHWRRNWQPTPVFLFGESQGWRSLGWAAVYGVAQSQTQLKWLSSSSSGSSLGSTLKAHHFLVLACMRQSSQHICETASSCQKVTRVYDMSFLPKVLAKVLCYWNLKVHLIRSTSWWSTMGQ